MMDQMSNGGMMTCGPGMMIAMAFLGLFMIAVLILTALAALKYLRT